MIKLNQFFSVCTQLVYEAGKIIKEIHDTKQEKKTLKGVDDQGVDDPVTQADLMGQQMIIKGLRKYWPDIKIIGEEDTLPEKEWNFDIKLLNENLLSEKLFMNEKLNNEAPLKDIIVWIDPLDGTLSYVKGELDVVTSLIGVSLNEKPLMGIIGKYFTIEKDEGDFQKNTYTYSPEAYIGHVNSNVYYINKLDDKFFSNNNVPVNTIPKFNRKKDSFVLATSQNRMTQEMQEQIDMLKPTKIKKYGGAGSKILNIATGNSDLYFYPKSGLKRWDTCAGEALLISFGGKLTDCYNNPYLYTPDQTKLVCDKGIVATLDSELHEEVIKLTKTLNVK